MGLVGGLLCLLAGLLLVLCFPWYNVAWLAWVVFVPLLTATRGVGWRTALLWGWISGCLGYLGILRWIPHTMISYGGVPILLSYSILLLLVVYVGLYVGVFTAVWTWSLRRWPRGTVLIAPALWVALEWVRAQALSGFPWASLGYSQYLNLPLIQVADFASVYGVSFALVLGNVVIAQLFYGTVQRRWKHVRMPCALAMFSLAAMWGYGGWRLHQTSTAPDPVNLTVALLQGNIEQDLKWDDAAREAIFSIYRGLTLEAAADPEVELIVWPEAATPFFFANDRVFQVASVTACTRSWPPAPVRQPHLRPRWRPRRHV